MDELNYQLTEEEKARLQESIRAALAIPFIDDVEDFVWEAIFHYVKGLRLPDPIREGRSKRLFDAISPDGTGWSLKALLWTRLEPGDSFEFVIQRADIFKKADKLGFPEGLNHSSPPEALGQALVRHWNQKARADARAQGVSAPRLAVLLKSPSRRRFVYMEFPYPPLDERQFQWRWSREDHLGLQGLRGGKVRLKWYHGQKQLFQVYEIPAEAFRFDLEWERLEIPSLLEALSVR